MPAETWRKLDPKSVQCIFIGYAETDGNWVYKLYQKETGRFLTSRDVVFDEASRRQLSTPQQILEMGANPVNTLVNTNNPEHLEQHANSQPDEEAQRN